MTGAPLLLYGYDRFVSAFKYGQGHYKERGFGRDMFEWSDLVLGMFYFLLGATTAKRFVNSLGVGKWITALTASVRAVYQLYGYTGEVFMRILHVVTYGYLGKKARQMTAKEDPLRLTRLMVAAWARAQHKFKGDAKKTQLAFIHSMVKIYHDAIGPEDVTEFDVKTFADLCMVQPIQMDWFEGLMRRDPYFKGYYIGIDSVIPKD